MAKRSKNKPAEIESVRRRQHRRCKIHQPRAQPLSVTHIFWIRSERIAGFIDHSWNSRCKHPSRARRWASAELRKGPFSSENRVVLMAENVGNTEGAALGIGMATIDRSPNGARQAERLDRCNEALTTKGTHAALYDPVGVDNGFMRCDFPGLRPGLTNMTPSGSKNCETNCSALCTFC